MSIAAMFGYSCSRVTMLLERLDVGDELVDLLVGDLTPERRHDRLKAADDLRLRIEDRLANVVFVDLDLALVGRLPFTPDVFPRWADEPRPRRRMTPTAPLRTRA